MSTIPCRSATLVHHYRADILKPKGAVPFVTDPRHTAINVGTAKNTSQILIHTSEYAKQLGRGLLIAAVAIPVFESIMVMRNPSASPREKLATYAKAYLDLYAVGLSFAVGGPIGVGIGLTYFALDYYFDFKARLLEPPVSYRRREDD